MAITIKTGHGGDVVTVLATGVNTNLVGDDWTTVNVGNNHRLLGILGALNIENPPSFTTGWAPVARDWIKPASTTTAAAVNRGVSSSLAASMLVTGLRRTQALDQVFATGSPA
jgi:hypothetical protein